MPSERAQVHPIGIAVFVVAVVTVLVASYLLIAGVSPA